MPASTPMMAQYEAVKKQNPDCMVFFRLGDFYELFGEDAREASQILGITLTARSSGEGRSTKVPMAGVPYHAANNYLQKLIKAGKKVAICEQMEEAKQAKGMVRRELVRIVTPGTVLEESMLDGRANNYLMALLPTKKALGLAVADNSTGEFLATELAGGDMAGLEAELERLQPAECLLPDGEENSALANLLGQRRLVQGKVDPYFFNQQEAGRVLKEHFQVASLEAFGLKEESTCLGAAGALLAYLGQTQKSPLSHFTKLLRYHAGSFMHLDASTQRHLELVANQEDGGRSGSLLEVLDSCDTAAGSRLLKRWLSAPLTDQRSIEQRLDAVQELVENSGLRARLHAQLKQCNDIERILARVGCLNVNPRDLVGLRSTLRCVPELKESLAASRSVLLKQVQEFQDFKALRDELEKALVEEPPLSLKEGGFIAQGYHPELDQIVADSHGGKEIILAIQQRERERTGIASLKVQFNSVFGYYIEINKSNLDKIPKEYERKQTLVNAERFTTPELKDLEERVLNAEERRCNLEYELFVKLREKVAALSSELLSLAELLSRLDALLSFSEAAIRGDYVRPKINNSEALNIKDGRHPVVELLEQKRGGNPFVPNDLFLNTQSQQIMLITGPNMAGKSTFMRQAALIVLMAQAGSFVPAKEAEIGIVDRVFTRVGASDRLSKGMSTFLVEMTETANILHHASRKSLVILDEIGRGTSTFDGVSIAWAVAEYLHEAPQLGCRCLFATHYFELTELAAKFSRIKNFSVAVREWNGKIIFMHQIRPGSSEHSYGIAVAKLAGVPEPVLSKARQVLNQLEGSRQGGLQSALSAESPLQPSLFEGVDPELVEMKRELEGLDLNSFTPLKALEWLHGWQGKIKTH